MFGGGGGGKPSPLTADPAAAAEHYMNYRRAAAAQFLSSQDHNQQHHHQVNHPFLIPSSPLIIDAWHFHTFLDCEIHGHILLHKLVDVINQKDQKISAKMVRSAGFCF